MTMMWRYKAVAMSGPQRGSAQRGEFAGDDPADVRASLRRVGLQVLDIRPARSRRSSPQSSIAREVTDRINKHLRARRKSLISEFYDSLATMIESGMPLLEAIETIRTAVTGRQSRWRSALGEMREQLRSGHALSESMEQHPGWFDPVEIAVVRAGQHAGELSTVLRRLAEGNERTDSLRQKLISALAYPGIVAAVGLGVVVFLSTRTLPDLTAILSDAHIETPRLTAIVMASGQFLSNFWFFIGLAILLVPLLMVAQRVLAARFDLQSAMTARMRDRLTPLVVRRIAIAGFAMRFAELIRSGVPAVEALRVMAPGLPASLQIVVRHAADSIEQGSELADALDDPHWFDAEFRQLLAIGQATGELDDLLDRIAERYMRRAARLIERLAALLEPAVILVLAALIGIVVMAAILPLVKLQEVF